MTAKLMQKYLIWKAGPGALDIEIKRVGEAVLRPTLLIVTPTSGVAIPHHDTADIACFHLSGHEVERIIAVSGTLRSPCLAFQCDAFLSMASNHRRWGWAIRVSRHGEALMGEHLDGPPLIMCNDGFSRARLSRIPQRSTMARSHAFIGFA